MHIMYALAMTVFLTTGEPQDLIIGVYDSLKECQTVAREQKIPGECYPVEKIIRLPEGEIPATQTVR